MITQEQLDKWIWAATDDDLFNSGRRAIICMQAVPLLILEYNKLQKLISKIKSDMESSRAQSNIFEHEEWLASGQEAECESLLDFIDELEKETQE